MTLPRRSGGRHTDCQIVRYIAAAQGGIDADHGEKRSHSAVIYLIFVHCNKVVAMQYICAIFPVLEFRPIAADARSEGAPGQEAQGGRTAALDTGRLSSAGAFYPGTSGPEPSAFPLEMTL
ncbi:hypothetical protein [Breoghania sp. L-A4]|uniref:hypothetical protein n=1 Tax=Breoghania sp. L-A4 TaxID=2304600 RepID=UPI0013C31966|nr:hypothetical protein [Breoghania sp. L-A4]